MTEVRNPIPASALKKLKRELPKQYRNDAVRRLYKAHKRKVSTAYVSQVLAGEVMDAQLLSVLADQRDAYLKELDTLTARIRGTRK